MQNTCGQPTEREPGQSQIAGLYASKARTEKTVGVRLIETYRAKFLVLLSGSLRSTCFRERVLEPALVASLTETWGE